MFWGDRIGRKRWLVGLGVLAAAGGVVFAFSSEIVVLGVAAFLGMLNSLGKDRAAALAIEQAILPSTGDDAGRTRAFAWYNVIQDVGHARGAARSSHIFSTRSSARPRRRSACSSWARAS